MFSSCAGWPSFHATRSLAPRGTVAPPTAPDDVLSAALLGDVDVLRSASPEHLCAAVDSSGATCLHCAAFSGQLEASLVLASPDAPTSSVDIFGFRPIEWAVLNGHTKVAHLLCLADREASSEPAIDGLLSPLLLAVAMGNEDMVDALLSAGVACCGVAENSTQTVAPLELANTLRHTACAETLQDAGLLELGRATPPAPTQPPPSPAPLRHTTAATLAADRHAWDAALTDSVPLLIEGLADEWSAGLSGCGFDELRRMWGEHEVRVAYSPDARYQRIECTEQDGGALRLLEPPTARMSFASFVDELRASDGDAPGRGPRIEHLAVQQSLSTTLAEFEGLGGRTMPELAERLVHGGQQPPEGLHANLWCCRPPKLSRLHYDADDSLLLQLSGTKRFTLIDPTPLGGLCPYPTRLPVAQMRRRARGQYARATGAEELGTGEEARISRNFPLVHISEATPDGVDPERFAPLSRHARTVTVDVPAGSGLLVPAYWYHEVESHTEDAEAPNVAVNYWWDSGAPVATRHRILRQRLYARA